jgi:hypothetical protein
MTEFNNVGNDWRFRLVSHLLVGSALLGCSPHPEPPRTTFELTDIDPRSQVIGVVPNDPTDPVRASNEAKVPVSAPPAGVTSSVSTDISPKQEASKMPLPGQANDHSTLSKVPSQRTTKPTAPDDTEQLLVGPSGLTRKHESTT